MHKKEFSSNAERNLNRHHMVDVLNALHGQNKKKSVVDRPHHT
jgi:hypothetical protein